MGRRGGMGASFMMDRPDRPIAPGTIRRVAGFFRPYRAQVALVLIAILVIAVVGLANPILLKLVIDDALLHRDVGKLTLYTALMIVIPIVTGLVGVGQTYLNNLIGQRVMR
ncbi:MAG: ABC transporter ATP-binding protein, partial [Chloroflexi bacterium]|nr:ABC transporter ATP-binding protein [Chloroflexota bacterium]